jgi:tRNA(Ile)-lysidine synthase
MVKLEKEVYNFLNKNIENFKDIKYLLGVSGGIDSMVLAYIFQRLQLKFGVAHINFQLRGDDSDSDEIFVKQWFDPFDIPLYFKKVNTIEYAEKNKVSIEEAARQLRYDFFEKLAYKYDYNYIVLAHHANDVIETLFINLLRGATINGLASIPKMRDNIIRPLWHVSRDEIERYTKYHNIPYRLDKTNDELIFLRNRIRHELLPLLRDMRAGVDKTLINNIDVLQAQSQCYNYLMKNYINSKINKYSDHSFSLDMSNIHTISLAVLHFLLSPLSATYDQLQNIINALPLSETRKFILLDYDVYTQKNILYVINNKTIFPELIIDKETKEIKTLIKLKIQILPIQQIKIKKSNNYAYIDLNKIIFPLKLRKIRDGDMFIPLGFHGKMKISDFLINQKASPIDKHFQYVIEDASSKIIWVVGRRISDLVKIDKNTKQVMVIELYKK